MPAVRSHGAPPANHRRSRFETPPPHKPRACVYDTSAQVLTDIVGSAYYVAPEARACGLCVRVCVPCVCVYAVCVCVCVVCPC